VFHAFEAAVSIDLDAAVGRIRGAGRSGLTAGDRNVADTLESFDAHLRENNVDFTRTKFRLGRELTIDPKTERSTDDEANRLFTRDYRKGFELPRV
jgi:hypothetical protein